MESGGEDVPLMDRKDQREVDSKPADPEVKPEEEGVSHTAGQDPKDLKRSDPEEDSEKKDDQTNWKLLLWIIFCVVGITLMKILVTQLPGLSVLVICWICSLYVYCFRVCFLRKQSLSSNPLYVILVVGASSAVTHLVKLHSDGGTLLPDVHSTPDFNRTVDLSTERNGCFVVEAPSFCSESNYFTKTPFNWSQDRLYEWFGNIEERVVKLQANRNTTCERLLVRAICSTMLPTCNHKCQPTLLCHSDCLDLKKNGCFDNFEHDNFVNQLGLFNDFLKQELLAPQELIDKFVNTVQEVNSSCINSKFLADPDDPVCSYSNYKYPQSFESSQGPGFCSRDNLNIPEKRYETDESSVYRHNVRILIVVMSRSFLLVCGLSASTYYASRPSNSNPQSFQPRDLKLKVLVSLQCVTTLGLMVGSILLILRDETLKTMYLLTISSESLVWGFGSIMALIYMLDMASILHLQLVSPPSSGVFRQLLQSLSHFIGCSLQDRIDSIPDRYKDLGLFFLSLVKQFGVLWDSSAGTDQIRISVNSFFLLMNCVAVGIVLHDSSDWKFYLVTFTWVLKQVYLVLRWLDSRDGSISTFSLVFGVLWSTSLQSLVFGHSIRKCFCKIARQQVQQGDIGRKSKKYAAVAVAMIFLLTLIAFALSLIRLDSSSKVDEVLWKQARPRVVFSSWFIFSRIMFGMDWNHALRKVKVIKAESQSLTSLDPRIQHFSNLEKLYLDNNNITYVDPSIELPNLKELSVLGNPVHSYLDWSNKQLSFLPKILNAFVSLESLNLSHNSLKEISESEAATFQKLSFKTLDLSFNLFSCFPLVDDNKYMLEKLNLANNRVTDLPPSVFTRQHLPRLAKLDLSNNNLISFSSSVNEWSTGRNCTKIAQFLVQGNPITELNWNLGGSYSSGKQSLCLAEELSLLEGIQKFYMRHHSISVIPDWFGNWTKLWVLDLSFNSHLKWTEGICKMSNLKTLLLEGSQEGTYDWALEKMPDCVSNLEELSRFRASFSQTSWYLSAETSRLHRIPNLSYIEMNEITCDVTLCNAPFMPSLKHLILKKNMFNYVKESSDCMHNSFAIDWNRLTHLKTIDFSDSFVCQSVEECLRLKCLPNRPSMTEALSMEIATRYFLPLGFNCTYSPNFKCEKP